MPAHQYKRGDEVWLELVAPGGPGRHVVDEVRCIILTRSRAGEYDLMIHPGEDSVWLKETLEECEVNIDDIKRGPVYVLANCQPEDIRSYNR